MGLTGSFLHTWAEESETETTTVEILYPEDLPESHENYALRGTTGSLTVPVQNILSSSYSSAYINIGSLFQHNNDFLDENSNWIKQTQIDACLTLWENYDLYLNHSQSNLEGNDLNYTFDYDPNTDNINPYSFVYNQLKSSHSESFSAMADC